MSKCGMLRSIKNPKNEWLDRGPRAGRSDQPHLYHSYSVDYPMVLCNDCSNKEVYMRSFKQEKLLSANANIKRCRTWLRRVSPSRKLRSVSQLLCFCLGHWNRPKVLQGQTAPASLTENIDWVKNLINRCHHQFISFSFVHFKFLDFFSGRIYTLTSCGPSNSYICSVLQSDASNC